MRFALKFLGLALLGVIGTFIVIAYLAFALSFSGPINYDGFLTIALLAAPLVGIFIAVEGTMPEQSDTGNNNNYGPRPKPSVPPRYPDSDDE